jgi:hypothetical protein
MKAWLSGIGILVTSAAWSQTTGPSGYIFKKSKPDNSYVAMSLSVGGYPTIGISSFPVTRFQYRYRSDAEGTTRQYADSLSFNSMKSTVGINGGLEIADRRNIVYRVSFGGMTGFGEALKLKHTIQVLV